MKITTKTLKEMIKEELKAILAEGSVAQAHEPTNFLPGQKYLVSKGNEQFIDWDVIQARGRELAKGGASDEEMVSIFWKEFPEAWTKYGKYPMTPEYFVTRKETWAPGSRGLQSKNPWGQE